MTLTSTDRIALLMSGDVLCISADVTLREAAEALVAEEVGAAVVTEEGQVVAILSERDIVRGVAEGADPDTTSVAEVMTEGPLCADPEDSIGLAAEKMITAGIRHMPVLGAGNPVGMVSLRDVVEVLTDLSWR